MGKPPDKGDGEQEEEDSGLWAYVIRTVRPIRRDLYPSGRNLPPDASPGRKAKRPEPPSQDAISDIISRNQRLITSPVAAAPPAGLDRRTEDKLRRGRMDIEAVLDLHGLTVAQALPRLQRFLTAGQAEGLRCVLVITGKGGRVNGHADENAFDNAVSPRPGILRQSLPSWLAEPPLSGIVLKHFPAKGRHGGSGAFYILLRRIR